MPKTNKLIVAQLDRYDMTVIALAATILRMTDIGNTSTGKNDMTWLYFGFILVTSFFTYFYGYSLPADPYWDEPYHIAAAQKYLHRVYFMEQHPPLAKLFIAAGEKLLHPNQKTNQFIDTDYARGFETVSFAGYRFFPALFGWLLAPLLFLIFYSTTRSGGASALFSFLYVFDNALIVHSRGAMTDSVFLFFFAVAFLFFVLLSDKNLKKSTLAWFLLSLGLGASFGLTFTTKMTGLLLVLLPLIAACRAWPDKRRALTVLLYSAVGFALTFVAVWQIHFALGTTINTKLNNEGYYQASGQYRAILANHTTASLSSFPIMIRDSLKYVGYYSKGVPRLDLCKKDENGSPFFLWPFGVHSIDYRWSQVDDQTYRYLYLQINPIIWACGLFAVLAAAGLLFLPLLFPLSRPVKHKFLIAVFFGLHACYMLAMSQISRVMYLYHYFPPLIISFILFALVVDNIESIGKRAVNEHAKVVGLTVLGLLIFFSYQYFRPLSYYEPISNKALEERNALFPLWELHCGKCERTSTLLVPVTE